MLFSISGNNIELDIDQVVVAGWTGRQQDAVNHHIEELSALGIAPPSQVPLYYRVSKSLLVHASDIEVLGETSSGEVEPLLLQSDNVWYLGLASDHTDRELESYSVAASKQACPKPVAQQLWPLDTVQAHLDALILRTRIEENGQWINYQEGTLSSIRPLAELINDSQLGNNGAMLCGTLPAIGEIRPALKYSMQLEDPILNRMIELNYSITALPIVQ